MIEALSGETTNLVKLALDAASLRHQAIANNIANANTPGYTPLKVNFEEQLTAARRASGSSAHPAQLDGVKAFIEEDRTAAGIGATNVMLDMEAAKLAQNVLHYQALLKGLNQHISLISMAINEGKR